MITRDGFSTKLNFDQRKVVLETAQSSEKKAGRADSRCRFQPKPSDLQRLAPDQKIEKAARDPTPLAEFATVLSTWPVKVSPERGNSHAGRVRFLTRPQGPSTRFGRLSLALLTPAPAFSSSRPPRLSFCDYSSQPPVPVLPMLAAIPARGRATHLKSCAMRRHLVSARSMISGAAD
jgi:hypothetical protein